MKNLGFAPILIVVILGLLGTGIVATSNPSVRNALEKLVDIKVESSPLPTIQPTATSEIISTPTPTVSTKPVTSTSPAVTKKNYGNIDIYPSQDGQVKRQEGPGSYVTLGFNDYYQFRVVSNNHYNIDTSITACFRILSSGNVPGQEVTYQVTDNGVKLFEQKLPSEPITSAGVAVCHQVPQSPGDHTIALNVNSNKAISETNYNNNSVSFRYHYEGDGQGPSITLPWEAGKYTNWGTCFFSATVKDNVTPYSEIKIEYFFDNQSTSPNSDGYICKQGTTGESHTFKVRATDGSGNTSEVTKNFTLF